MAVAPAPPATAGAPDALLRAFLDGAGLPGASMPAGMSPETMRTIGEMLRLAVQGTLDLVSARALLKREVRAEVTMIVAKNNNPFKFLPDADSVLLQMFGQRVPGFMAPAEAMEDAYADLRAHQAGLIAGMRAVLAEILDRVGPEVIERSIGAASGLDSLVAAFRKARLWDRYGETYGALRRESQDDPQTFFNRAFVRAYEEEIERVRAVDRS
jgi:FHA domain-containing protein